MMNDVIIAGNRISIQQLTIAGNRATIIFLHDSLGSVSLWRSFPQELAQRTQCNALVYDRQGYGQSAPFTTTDRQNDYLEIEADTLIKLMDACQLPKAILFGHSDGGSIALIAAAKYPQRISAIITEGAHIFVEPITLAGIRDAVDAWHKTSLEQKLQKYHGAKAAAVFNAWTTTWLKPSFASWNIEHFLPQIQCPVLVIQGEKDEFGSIAQVKGILRGIAANAQELIVPDSGHTPHKESSQIVLQKTAAFIRMVDGSIEG